MWGLFGSRWNQFAFFLIWALSLLILYAYMDSRLETVHKELRIIHGKVASSKFEENDLKHEDWGQKATRTWNPENLIVLYNRVPKTGSTSFMNGVAYELCKANNFHSIHLNVSKNAHTMTLADQARFVQNITNWIVRKPAIYHGHVAFIDFSKFGQPNPIYLNVIREPLDRFVSYYYFLRYGDNYRQGLVRKRAGNTETFDECVDRGGVDCDPTHMWLQIPFFCGHSARCWTPNPWALAEAKHNLLHHYLLVGITEELTDFVAVLEATLPRFFSGATQKFVDGENFHLRKTNKKPPLSEKTIEKISQNQVYLMEKEFYEFAKEQFHFVRDRLLIENANGLPAARKQEFHYEKIKPKLRNR